VGKNTPELSSPKARFLVFAISTAALAVLHAFVLAGFGYSTGAALTDASISTLFLAVTIASMYFSNVEGGTLRRRLIAWISGSALCTVATIVVLHCAFTLSPRHLPLVDRSILLRCVFIFIVTGLAGLLFRALAIIASQQEKAKQNISGETLIKDAELHMLRLQLQPHFLFNSLNSISALVTLRPEEARSMIQKLSDFLRATIRIEPGKLVVLKDEIAQLQLYLDIEKTRFGHRLSLDIQVAPDTAAMQLPPLVLQPVVENAIKYGLYDSTGDILITLHTRNAGHALEIEVTNPFDIETQAANQGSGFGLLSIEKRLFLLYGRRDLVRAGHEENIYKVKILIPQHDV
jgi:two-component system, LytTR family, sensor kinase